MVYFCTILQFLILCRETEDRNLFPKAYFFCSIWNVLEFKHHVCVIWEIGMCSKLTLKSSKPNY